MTQQQRYSYHFGLTGKDAVDAIHALLKETYWASQRTRQEVEAALHRSVTLTVHHIDDGIVGCARAVTDGVTFSWICDVVVAPAHRGRGVGTQLVRRLLDHPDVVPTRKVLATKDAQPLYRSLGFKTHPFECMIMFPDSGTAIVVDGLNGNQ